MLSQLSFYRLIPSLSITFKIYLLFKQQNKIVNYTYWLICLFYTCCFPVFNYKTNKSRRAYFGTAKNNGYHLTNLFIHNGWNLYINTIYCYFFYNLNNNNPVNKMCFQIFFLLLLQVKKCHIIFHWDIIWILNYAK